MSEHRTPIEHSAEKVLQFWRAVELFSPQALPGPKDSRRMAPVVEWRQGDLLPWQEDHPLRKRSLGSMMTWRHFVYLGIFDLESASEELENHFGRDRDASERRPSGQACLGCFTLTDLGRPLIDTFTISSLAWALGRTRRPGPRSPAWLEGFDDAQAHEREAFASRMALSPEDEEGQRIIQRGFKVGPPLFGESLAGEVLHLIRALGWPQSHSDLKAFVHIRSIPVSRRRKYSVDDLDFLNSFFVNDLRRVARAVAERQGGAALKAYLQDPDQIDPDTRIDLCRNPAALREALVPKKFPAGRWPAPGNLPLVLSQQAAVNLAFQELGGKTGLFSVNGPPGSGKTTLLRDVVAAVVVQRADVLASLSSPQAAFSEVAGKWRVNQYWRSIRHLHPDLYGHEIVVASSNNGAVENVTREIPAERAVDPSWRNGDSYFADVASAVIGEPSWALLAAPLGNKANRGNFVSSFWYGPEAGLEAPEGSEEDSAENGSLGFLKLLKEAARISPPSWDQAVKRYGKARDEVRRITRERQKAAEMMECMPRWRNEIDLYSQKAVTLEKSLSEAESSLAECVSDRERQAELCRLMEGQLQAVLQAKPGLLAILFSWGKEFKEWSQEARTRRARLDEAIQSHGAADKRATEAGTAVARLKGEVQQTMEAKAAVQRQYADAKHRIDGLEEELGGAFPGPAFWDKAEADRQLASPWIDKVWNRARAELFIEALALHRALIFSVPDIVRRNLQGAMDILTGQVSDGASSDAIRAAWATLFLVVPVVSTTFASFDRLFSHLREEDLGWLLIDEAGQAIPQAAAGAIWRAKRIMVVGDPQQLEPVVTIPESVMTALRKHFEVVELWQPNAISVQSLADRAATFGTTLNSDEDPIWIGVPLRVHRRCDDPMFSIANRIAYDEMMIFGTPRREVLPAWPESCWIDVEADESEGNWVPLEGSVALTLLRSLPDMESVVCLSPFRHVVFGLRDLLGRDFPDLHIGTVHTYQGKEAKAILLILGGSIDREGPLNWAASRPNLLNVAVTRAQRRLYVIGNHRRWRAKRYFSEMARNLERISTDRLLIDDQSPPRSITGTSPAR